MDVLAAAAGWMRERLAELGWMESLRPLIDPLPDWALITTAAVIIGGLISAVVMLMTVTRSSTYRSIKNKRQGDVETDAQHGSPRTDIPAVGAVEAKHEAVIPVEEPASVGGAWRGGATKMRVDADAGRREVGARPPIAE